MSKVLIIEPDKLSAKLYATALENVGHTVRTVYAAQGALNALDTELPDIILLELDIPAHSGLEFLYEFCTYEDWVNIPIVIHSSVQPEKFTGMLVDWAELNVHEYLYKAANSLSDLQRAVTIHSEPSDSISVGSAEKIKS